MTDIHNELTKLGWRKMPTGPATNAYLLNLTAGRYVSMTEEGKNTIPTKINDRISLTFFDTTLTKDEIGLGIDCRLIDLLSETLKLISY